MALAEGRRRRGAAPREYAMGDEFEILTMDGHARYQEAVARGRCFVGGTAATGVAPGTAIGTTAAFSLTNPLSSGVNLVVLRASMGYVSGTLGAGVVHYLANVNTQLALPTGTAITATNCLLGSALAAAGKPLTTATIAAPIVLRPFYSLTALTAALSAAPWQVMEEVAGEFVIAPGATLSLHGTTAAGSSPLVVYGMTWEEVPITA